MKRSMRCAKVSIGACSPSAMTSVRGLLLSMIFLSCAFAAASPQFDSNSVPLHAIKKFAPTKIPERGIDWKMRDYLHYSDKSPLNFADKYTLFEIGCGTGCLEFCLIDRTTGTR